MLGLGEDALFQAIEINGRAPYIVTARIPLPGDDTPGALTQNQLRVAGDGLSRPRSWRGTCRSREGAIGPAGPGGCSTTSSPGNDDNPFDVATTMVGELQSSRFKYDDQRGRDVDCGDLSVARMFRDSPARVSASSTRR